MRKKYICFRHFGQAPKLLLPYFLIFFFLCDADANDACFGTAGSDVCACNPGYSGNPCSGRLIQILTLRFVTSYCICVMNRIRLSSSSLSSFYLIKHVIGAPMCFDVDSLGKLIKRPFFYFLSFLKIHSG